MTITTQRKPPKGGRKGGTVFPKIDLKQAHDYAKKLVSKTHSGPQPDTIILTGVFNNAGAEGKVRASALKQFSLLEGEPTAYQATQLARDIVSAPSEELSPLLQKACLAPKLFKTLFDTFQNDTVTTAKIRQQAINFKVHPDTADECVKIFVGSLQYAGLAKVNQDDIIVSKFTQVATHDLLSKDSATDTSTETETIKTNKSNSQEGESDKFGFDPASINRRPITPSFQVSISIDPSMDPDKLEKLLKLLKQYGAI